MVGSGVHEGRSVGLKVAEGKPCLVGVGVIVTVLVGEGLGVSVSVGGGTRVAVGSVPPNILHPETERSTTKNIAEIHMFRLVCTFKMLIASLYLLCNFGFCG